MPLFEKDTQHGTTVSLKYHYQCSHDTEQRKSRVCRVVKPNQFKCLNFFFFFGIRSWKKQEISRNLMGAWVICKKIINCKWFNCLCLDFGRLWAAKGCLLLLISRCFHPFLLTLQLSLPLDCQVQKCVASSWENSSLSHISFKFLIPQSLKKWMLQDKLNSESQSE